LLVTTVALIPVAFVIPYAPFADVMGFVPVPALLQAMVAVITILYVAATEWQKTWFYRPVR
jgi:Mg2+-importing ATPase